MQILDLLRQRFAAALLQMAPQLAAEPGASGPNQTDADPDSSTARSEQLRGFAMMVRPTSDTRHGDYQANCAMPLAKLLGGNPRETAQRLVAALQWDDLCQSVEIAGPGFINLRLRDSFLGESTRQLLTDPQLGVAPAVSPQTILIDYSSPNVAKPMHVGHIRSTVIGDALSKVMRFLGHRVITDNHLGDWGTQFGMIIYGFKHFGDEASFAKGPVPELSRLYRLVNKLIEYHDAVESLDKTNQSVDETRQALQAAQAAADSAKDSKDRKQREKAVVAAQKKYQSSLERVQKLTDTIEVVRGDSELLRLAQQHPCIATAVLEETAKLHSDDPTNLELWQRFLPFCKDEINRIYDRLQVSFDHTLGESFYHSMLADVVAELRTRGLASDSEGAVCVFLPEFDAPMIVQKRDGAYLYATTDLATLVYRREQFSPDEILYVVDTRQSEHFEKLFAVALRMGFSSTRLVHVNFGTVLGDDGKPFKTRSGSSIGLESLLDDAVARAFAVVCDPERSSRLDPPLTDQEKRHIANVVGHGAIKYADLAHHRTSDYRFDLEKMVSLEGNTSAYIQYAYARVQGILQRGKTDESTIASQFPEILLEQPAERALALQLLRLGESLEQVRSDYAPNALVDYLYETAKAYAIFNDSCPVLKADNEALLKSRLALVAATGRILRQGLELLGIGVVSRM
ncbi:MAG: arginine--tRNA ligase [Planctomycetaceae bacterium]